MANTTTKAKKITKTTKAAKPAPAEQVAITAADNVVVEPESKRNYKVKSNLDPNMVVTVKNGFNGTLVYKSKKTGERFIWDEFGAEQDMELSELKSAKNSCKSFFTNNWFLFDDPEIIEWLGLGQYYKNALDAESFDALFDKSPDEIVQTIEVLSKGQKKSVAFRAKQLITNGKIDSIKTITALEKSLSIELIER